MYRSNYIVDRQFDFDIGYLKKSPCRTCLRRPLLPDCADSCAILDRIQTRLARGVSTTHTHSPLEPYAVYLEDCKGK
jgi:hypothetical protein